jgi:uncharacterized protein YbdZ (MbtH family)
MFGEEDEDQTIYRVVLNHEEQYSIWPADRDLPPGWRDEGTIGEKAACLSHIDEVWTDMRPLSLRKYMEENANRPVTEDLPQPEDEEESLVERLSTGDHPAEISLRPERTASALKAAIDRGHVFVRFTDTKGGTELGVRLDPDATRLDGADFEACTGQIRLEGDLTLDFEPVRCVADIELATMEGLGRLIIREAAL